MKKNKLSDQTIREMAKHVSLFKGQPWSWSEFNALKTTIRQNLIEAGATEKQLEEFERLVDQAPIIGNSFNSWSGD